MKCEKHETKGKTEQVSEARKMQVRGGEEAMNEDQ